MQQLTAELLATSHARNLCVQRCEPVNDCHMHNKLVGSKVIYIHASHHIKLALLVSPVLLLV